MKRRLVVATTNPGKVRELRPLLEAEGWEVVGLDAFPPVDAPVEDGATFAANAELKARYYAEATGAAVLADDSGLDVTALDGAPGVHSARFAGEDADDAANNALLLEKLAGVADRRARFVCSLCLVADGAVLAAVEGRCEGALLDAPRGEGGFGYDPLFVPAESDGRRSFGEFSRDEKAAISHRGLALRALQAALADGASAGGPAGAAGEEAAS